MNITSKLAISLAVAAVIIGGSSTSAQAGHFHGVSIGFGSGCGTSYYYGPATSHYRHHHSYKHHRKHRRHIRRHYYNHGHHTVYNPPIHYYYGGSFHYRN